MYHDNTSSRSPGSQRHQQPLHRQPSRQFDAYGPMPTNHFDESLARHETSRMDRLNPLHTNGYGYEISGAQTWNTPNGFNGPSALGGIGSATGRMRPSARGRTGLPSVSILPISHHPPPKSISLFFCLPFFAFSTECAQKWLSASYFTDLA